MPDPPFTAPVWWTGNDLDRLLNPREFVVPVLGAGLSRAAGLPDAADLAAWLRERVPFTEPPPEGAGLFSVVDAIDPSKMSSLELRKLVAEQIARQPLTPTPFLNQLVRLPSRFIITLNYDDLVGVAAEQQGLAVCRLSMLDEAERQEAHRRITARTWPPTELTILHLHGRAAAPETLVLDDAPYRSLARFRDFEEIVFSLAHHRCLTFLGTALDEPYLLTELHKQFNAPYHLVLCRDDAARELTTGRAALSRRQHLVVVGYPDHADLSVLSRWLTAPPPDRGPAQAAELLGDVVPSADSYIKSELRDRARDDEKVDEDALRDAHRTLVIGGAGTGKTHLVSWLAARAADDRPAVRIRLADVSAQPGRPERVLRTWSLRARSSPDRPVVDVSPSALSDDRLHFLLDGLDEVANDQQRTVAELIDQVASRYPQHAFTVTSRPVPSLAVFGDSKAADTTWQRVELKPGFAWQERFLKAQGLDLAQLEAVMPALSDMRDLLHNPFLLTHTVRLFEQGELVGLRDVGELLARLVDVALAREEEQLLALDVDDARAWLRRVALAATIAGRRTFTFDDLRDIPIADADGMVGDLNDLVHQLQLRLLLGEEDGRLRFSHRYIADQLAAEALVETAPSNTLLDALVPVIDDELAGVRDDAVIAVTLTCLRSAEWRSAVAKRDPLAAARATPVDAPAAERAAAIELVLDTYDDWQIWNWDRDAPDLVEDAEVLARLLRAEPDDARVQRLRRAIHDGDAVRQGNAIRVLTRVQPDGLDDDLRAVLGDKQREGVVVRQAAIGASDLGWTGLIDDIVGAMIASPESVVQQDCSIALRRLAPDDRLLELATRLVRGCSRDAGMFAAMIKGRLTPAERIHLSYVLAVERVDTHSEDRVDLRDAVRLAEPNPELIAETACAAALWRVDSNEVLSFLAADPLAAASGLLHAQDHGAEWWEVMRIASHADLDTLKAANVDARIIERVEHQREIDAMTQEERDELRRSIEASMQESRRDAEKRHPSPLRLSEILRRDPQIIDAGLNENALDLATQVQALDGTNLDALRERLAAMWPAEPFADLFAPSGSGYTLAWPAPAWLFLAPAATMPVDDDQWLQLAATTPFRLSDVAEWLRGQATSARMCAAVTSFGETSPEAWLHLLACCTLPAPRFVAEACLAVVEASAEEGYAIHELASQLTHAGLADAAQQWAERDPIAAAELAPMLARQGDEDSQRALLDGLLADEGKVPPPSMDDVNWMAALRSPGFLPPLFAILELVFPANEDDAPEHGPPSALNPTLNAIDTIGSRDAVRLFDQLLARRDRRRWLRSYRDKVAAGVVRAAGGVAARAALIEAALPDRFADQ